MAGAAWWAMHAVQVAALTAAVVLALAAGRRIGAHTWYGNLLFLLGLGFWLLLVSEFVFLGRHAVGAWAAPGTLADPVAWIGWTLLAGSVLMFVAGFSRMVGGSGFRVRLAAFLLVPTVAVLLLFRSVLSPAGADPQAWVRVPYLAIDGVALGAILFGLGVFGRLRESALGRLYLFLGAALVLKMSGDLYWAYLAARGMESLLATLPYPVAGALAVAGLALHLRDMRREGLSAGPVAAPWLRREQRILRDAALRLRGMAGGHAARTTLGAAAGAFEERGIAWRLHDAVLEAEADGEAWEDALRRAEDHATGLLGGRGGAAVAEARRTRGGAAP